MATVPLELRFAASLLVAFALIIATTYTVPPEMDWWRVIMLAGEMIALLFTGCWITCEMNELQDRIRPAVDPKKPSLASQAVGGDIEK